MESPENPQKSREILIKKDHEKNDFIGSFAILNGGLREC